MKKNIFIFYTLTIMLTSCDIDSRAKTCPDFNKVLITYGYDFNEVQTIVFRTYKKGTNFKDYLGSYIVKLDKDELANQKPDNREVINKERSIIIPDKITTDFDFAVVIGDSTKTGDNIFKISDVESFLNNHDNAFCDIRSYRLNDSTISSKNITVYRPGFIFK